MTPVRSQPSQEMQNVSFDSFGVSRKFWLNSYKSLGKVGGAMIKFCFIAEVVRFDLLNIKTYDVTTFPSD